MDIDVLKQLEDRIQAALNRIQQLQKENEQLAQRLAESEQRFNEVNARLGEHEEARIAGLRAKTIDYAFLTADGATRLKDEKGIVITRGPRAYLYIFQMNRQRAPWSDKRVRHLPVLEAKKVIGIVSIGDLVKSIIGDQKFIIEQLEHYIHG